MLLAVDLGAGTDGDDVIYLRPRLSPHQGSWLLDMFINADPGGAPTRVATLEQLPLTSEFTAGAGNDRITIEKVEGAPRYRVLGGAGDDAIEIIRSAAGEDVIIEDGIGMDSLTITGSPADDAVSIRSGPYSVMGDGFEFSGIDRLSVDTGDGTDKVEVTTGPMLPPHVIIETGANGDAVDIGWSAFGSSTPVTPTKFIIDLGDGNDAVTFRGGMTVGLLQVEGREGNDRVWYRSGDRGTPDLVFNAGDGNDELKLDDLRESFAIHRFQYDPGPGDDRLTASAYPSRGRFDIRSSHALYNDHLVDFRDVEHQTYSSGSWVYFASEAPDVSLSQIGNAHVVLAGGRMPKGLDGSSSPTTIEFTDGHYELPQASCGCGSGNFAGATIIVRGDASVATASQGTIDKIEVDDGGKVILGRDLTSRFLRLKSGGTLDLDRHRLSIRVPAGDAPLALRQVEALIASARNGGAAGPWTGAGITSGAIAGDASQTLIAFIDPRVIDSRDVTLVVERRLAGDATRDSRVNADDYFRIDQGFLARPQDPLYADGDFNYDGRIDADDYFLIDQAFLAQSAVAATITSTMVAVAAPSDSTTSTAVGRRVEPDHRFFNATRRIRSVRRFR